MASEPSNEKELELEANLFKKIIKKGDDYYEAWEKRFRCDKLEEYFEGHQWKTDGLPHDYRPYVVNLVYSTIQTKIPSTLFSNPVFNLIPRPYLADYNPTEAFQKARLKEDTLNSFVMDRRNRVAEEFEEIAYDVFFRFGVIECGYSAYWYENPSADKPIVDLVTEETDPEKLDVKQPKFLAKDERIYVKAINPKTFRIFRSDNRYLERCGAVGYYEYFQPEDLYNTPGIKNTDKIRLKSVATDSLDINEQDKEYRRTLIKCWHYWDNREKMRYLIDDDTGYVLKRFKFKRLPIKGYAPIKRRKVRGFYPIPLAYNWLSPQDELNETREAMRTHRRKFKRSFIVNKSAAIDEAELVKIIHGGDGAFAYADGTNLDNIIRAVESAPMDQAGRDSMVVSKDDFNIVSGTSADQRGEADRVTATQANLISESSKIRESHERIKFANYLCDVGNEIIQLHIEKLTDPIWIKRFADSQGTLGVEVQAHSATWEQIMIEELEGDDFDVEVNISSLSPIANEDEKKKLFELLATLKSYPEAALMPDLIQEIMDRIGYRNQRVAQMLQNMAMMQLGGIAQMAGQQQVEGLSQQNMAKATPNQQEQTQQQITNGAGRI